MGSLNKVFIVNPYQCNITDGGPSGVIAHNILGHESEFYQTNEVCKRYLYFGDYLRKKFTYGSIHSEYHDWCVYCHRIFREYEVSRYPIVYFHDVFSLFFCLNHLSSRQKVILQSHSPQLPHEEVSEHTWSNQSVIDWVINVERTSFNRADYIVFPNKDVIDIYSSLMPGKAKVIELVTGVRDHGRLVRYPFDNKNTYFLYIGRRNRIKGYDILIDAFKIARRKWDNIVLVLVGNGQEYHDDFIIDVGFSSRPQNLINSCDYVVNCNRQSYFDLSILETLSIGTPIIMSTNYGHKFFSREEFHGIFSMGEASVECLVNSIDYVMKNSINKTVYNNRNVYETYLTDKIYRNSLSEICKKLLNNDMH
jgi:glycosyltransferase involved in cell wall biosynthesis